MENRKEIEAKIIAKCWKDPSYKERLQNNPQEALKELNILLPEGMTFSIVHEEQNEWCLLLPNSPHDAKEMSDSELQRLAAGTVPKPPAQPN